MHRNGGNSRVRDVMAENWLRSWPGRSQRRMRLKFIPLKTGRLTVSIRAAFMRRRKVINIPSKGYHRDQQGYFVERQNLYISKSNSSAQNLAALFIDPQNDNQLQKLTLNLQRLLADPDDNRAWSYFKQESPLSSYGFIDNVRTLFKNHHITKSPNFVENLLVLVNDPTNVQAAQRLGITFKKPKRQKWSDQVLNEAANNAEAFLRTQQGGTAILSLFAAENDLYWYPTEQLNTIAFVRSPNKSSIFRNYPTDIYEFIKNDQAVLKIAKTIIRIKPDTEYQYKPEPMSNTSYNQIINALR
ncbi:hypothetical protein TI03_00255 [Achromatium sp. WMS1]|nr:hypothetical protein TI03_00255 [Achromatium sp. WMS1]